MSENQRDPQYKLRWSEELREKISQSAKEHNRSMNADIVARLEESFSTININNINFAKGYLLSYLRVLATTHYISMNELKKQYESNPSTDLLSQIDKHELLFNEIMKLSEREEELNRLYSESPISEDDFKKLLSTIKKAP
ncbi:Arc family DNA-binding protein [Acinetobacter sp.]|uniref:Arc family DNA-binding protein n=1 Tax=Acinetobacter sp. TaxID=472 RepID=UPI0028A6F802|nr:Arc family DNA-binding protein [Acinetobacter sp.]